MSSQKKHSNYPLSSSCVSQQQWFWGGKGGGSLNYQLGISYTDLSVFMLHQHTRSFLYWEVCKTLCSVQLKWANVLVLDFKRLWKAPRTIFRLIKKKSEFHMCYVQQLLLAYVVAAGRSTFLKIRILRGLNTDMRWGFAKEVKCLSSMEKRFRSCTSITFSHPLGKSLL